jgi:hypothetical protein
MAHQGRIVRIDRSLLYIILLPREEKVVCIYESTPPSLISKFVELCDRPCIIPECPRPSIEVGSMPGYLVEYPFRPRGYQRFFRRVILR